MRFSSSTRFRSKNEPISREKPPANRRPSALGFDNFRGGFAPLEQRCHPQQGYGFAARKCASLERGMVLRVPQTHSHRRRVRKKAERFFGLRRARVCPRREWSRAVQSCGKLVCCSGCFEQQSRPRGWHLRSEVQHRLLVTVGVLFAPEFQQQGRHLGQNRQRAMHLCMAAGAQSDHGL